MNSYNSYIKKCIDEGNIITSQIDSDVITDISANNDTNKNDIAISIRENLHIMNDTEMINFHKKILSMTQIRNDLLCFELKNVKLDPIDDFGGFIEFMEMNLARFHTKIMNTMLEDSEWTFHDHTSKKYPLKENEIIYENSIHKSHINDKITFNYLSELSNFFNRHILDKSKLKVTLKLIKWSDGIFWVIFKLEICVK